MIVESTPANPVIHQAAIRLAYRCVGIIEPLLRQEEIPEAAREFYQVAREEIEKLQKPGS